MHPGDGPYQRTGQSGESSSDLMQSIALNVCVLFMHFTSHFFVMAVS